MLVADYRVAAGTEFRHVVVCGAFEGSFPAGPGGDTLVDDGEWARLRETHPFIEDASLRISRSRAAATRAIAAAGKGRVTWMAPLFEPGGSREFYASPMMVEAARQLDPSVRSASDLRRAATSGSLRRAPSPLAAGMRGPAVDKGESSLRAAVKSVKAGGRPGPGSRLHAPMALMRARRSREFTAFDGNLAALSGRLVDGADGLSHLVGGLRHLRLSLLPEVDSATERGRRA